jgi:rhodanese-related sulfurtransferase
MQTISREELRGKMDENRHVAIIEVLSPDQYEQGHLPGAMNIPFGEGFDEAMQQAIPDKNAEVVVYCANKQCQASPKAARRLDELGYEHVYDYEDGKAGWKEADLPLVQ